MSDAPGRAERLVVFVPARRDWGGAGPGAFHTGTEVAYFAVGPDGRGTVGHAAIADLPRARSCEIVFSALDVFCGQVDVPRLSDARLRQALPNLLEERILGDALDHHYAFRRPPGRAAAGTIAVAAIARGTLARVIEVFSQAQCPVAFACSRLHAIAPPAGAVLGVHVEGLRGFVRTGAQEGCMFDLEDPLPGALLLAVRGAGATRLRVQGDNPQALEPVARALGVAIEPDPQPFDDPALQDATNLMQGAFAARGAGPVSRALQSLVRTGAWKAPAAWAAACVLAAVAGINGLWLEREAQLRQVRQSMNEAFRDAIPEEPSVVDAVGQARRTAAALRVRSGGQSSDDFLALDAQAQLLLAEAPATLVASIEYADRAYRIRFRPGAAEDASLRNSLHAQARRIGVSLAFDADGSALLSPAR
jgi:general secretion pathway protein L